MPASLIVTAVLVAGATSALRRKGRNDLIIPRPYNNRHSDATAARDERALLISKG